MSPRRIGGVAMTSLSLGLVIGWMLAGGPGGRLRADGGDRWGDSIVAAGPIGIKHNMRQQVQIAEEAVYYLNYASGRLLASVPSFQQVGRESRVLGEFAERDLVRDFELSPGTSPHFLMTTAT